MFINLIYFVFLSVLFKDNFFEMINFENLDRMKSFVLVCICNER